MFGQRVLVKSPLLNEPAIGTLEEVTRWHPAYNGPAIRVNFPQPVPKANWPEGSFCRLGWFRDEEVFPIKDSVNGSNAN